MVVTWATDENWYDPDCIRIKLEAALEKSNLKILFVPLRWNNTQEAFNRSVDTQIDFFINAIPRSASPEKISKRISNVTTQNYAGFNCTSTNCGVGSIKPFYYLNPTKDMRLLVATKEEGG